MPKLDGPTFAKDLVISHKAMLADIERIAGRARGKPLTKEDAAQLARWFDKFGRMVEYHHVAEDEDVFRLLAERDAEFAALRGQLAEDHRGLHAALEKVTAAFASLGTDCDGTARAGCMEALGDAATALHVFMRDHLAREEAAIVERIRTTFSVDDVAAVETRMRKRYRLRDMAWSVSWILDSTQGAERDAVTARIPGPLLALHRWFWEKSYRRTVGLLA